MKTTNQTLRVELLSRAQIELVDSLPHAQARYDAASRSSASSCLEGTRVELLRTIREWVHTNDVQKPRIFWLCGLAGTGKSTIAQTIAEELDTSHTLGATFFFSRNSAECSNALLVFSTIARQLALAIPEFGARIAEAIEANRDAGKLVMNAQLEKLIIEPLRSVTNPPDQTVIVIDALDECSDRKLAQDILILFAGKICTLPFPLTIFITSRSEMHIKSKFDTPILRPISRPFILHDIEQSIVGGDIELYLRQKMKEIGEASLIEKEWPSNEAIIILRDRARGLFIYAATAVKFVADEFVDNPKDQLNIILNRTVSSDQSSPFADIDKLYLQVLESSLPQGGQLNLTLIQHFQEIVGTIVLLMDPLPLAALEDFLGVASGTAHSALKFLHSLIVVPKSSTEPIHIIHPSFHDFLVEHGRCPDHRFALDAPLHHERLAVRCLEIMIFHLKRNICGLDDTTQLNREVENLAALRSRFIPAHLIYACSYWGLHLSKSRPSPTSDHLLMLLRQFVDSKLLYWLEVLSLQNIMDAALPAIGHAQVWYSISSDTDETSALLNDVQRFTVEFFEPIKEGAGQIYHSALCLSPPCTLTTQYKLEIMQGISFIKGGQHTWGPCLRAMPGHKGMINSISCSPDGKFLVSGSCDRTIRVWDAVSGSTLATLMGHTQYVRYAEFSPDGERIISASDDKTIRVWEPTTGANFHILSGHEASVYTAKFSPDGTLILSASIDKSVRVWNSETGQVLAILQGDYSILDASFDPLAQAVVVGDTGGRVALWNWQHDMTSSFIHCHANGVTKVHFNHDGTQIASCSYDRTATVITTSGNVLCTMHCPGTSAARFYDAVFSADQTHIWTSDHFMRCWNIGTGEAEVSFNTQGGAIKSLAFFPGHQQVALGMIDNSMKMITKKAFSSCYCHRTANMLL
ncbi:WD40-repeat-containing domain protein [Lentinula raphanica]|nr:WD40-repeat-containing domain protein [Lentinula raphanica]